jgi:hypothetical protein
MVEFILPCKHWFGADKTRVQRRQAFLFDVLHKWSTVTQACWIWRPLFGAGSWDCSKWKHHRGVNNNTSYPYYCGKIMGISLLSSIPSSLVLSLLIFAWMPKWYVLDKPYNLLNISCAHGQLSLLIFVLCFLPCGMLVVIVYRMRSMSVIGMQTFC